MKLPVNWLREWVDTDLDADEIAERLTLYGHEVDSVTPLVGVDDVIVAEVATVEPHPNADRLSVCQVRCGSDEPAQIVCGAPNVRAGMRSLLALPGATIGGNRIRRSKLRGIESEGMLCSAAELGLGADHDGIVDLPGDPPIGQTVGKLLELPDAVLDVDLTPNRGDCFSVLGLAREVSAAADARLREREHSTNAPAIADELPVRVDAPADCPRFAGRIVRGIRTDVPTPLWMQEKLRRAGVRSIHPVVDITNYVLLELGQPLHAYDLAKLSGGIVVRRARDGESLVLLDEREVRLADDVLVIADQDQAVGLAGIMGGLSTAVSSTTEDIFFEGAFFAPAAVAGRARRYGLHTDASLRFERGVDPAQQVRAIDRATELLLEISGGEAGPMTEVASEDDLPLRAPVKLTWAALDRLLGVELDRREVGAILSRLGMAVREEADGVVATPPSYRFDIGIAEDLIEEVVRIHGYDQVPEITARYADPLPPVTETLTGEEALRTALVTRGFNEIVSYSFVDPVLQQLLLGDAEELTLANPLSSELSTMRRALLPGLVATLRSNQARQRARVRLFEIGNCFDRDRADHPEVSRTAAIAAGTPEPEQWGVRAPDVDFFDIKSDLEALIGTRSAEFRFEPGAHPGLHPGQTASVMLNERQVGWIGTLHPGIASELGLSGSPVYFEVETAALTSRVIPAFEPLSRFPSVRRDLALLVDAKTPVQDIVDTTRAALGESLRELRVFDIYQGKGIEDGRKSVALGLILQETSRTLTDEETDRAVRSVLTELERHHGATLRDG